MKKVGKILLILLFPLGIIFCIGRALFTGKDFYSYLGMFFIFGLGVLLGIYLGNPEMVKGWINTIGGWFS